MTNNSCHRRLKSYYIIWRRWQLQGGYLLCNSVPRRTLWRSPLNSMDLPDINSELISNQFTHGSIGRI